MSENYDYCMGCGKVVQRINLDVEQNEYAMCENYPKCEKEVLGE